MKQDDFIFPAHSCLPTGFLPCLEPPASIYMRLLQAAPSFAPLFSNAVGYLPFPLKKDRLMFPPKEKHRRVIGAVILWGDCN
ncbi:hypothetical protein CSPX01_04586 [Colletotrichum filicis]|nr:hypothetical protein CSPX01_04586 [Colletotrichum filicis]